MRDFVEVGCTVCDLPRYSCRSGGQVERRRRRKDAEVCYGETEKALRSRGLNSIWVNTLVEFR